jgi:uncharacterized protein
MRLVIDTNMWISALIKRASPAGELITLIEEGKHHIVVSDEQFVEFRRVSRYAKMHGLFFPSEAGQLVNNFRDLGIMVTKLPTLDLPPDPFDNYLLAMAQAGEADFLTTGDKADLLALGTHGRTAIVSVRQFLKGQS